ncbi:hypothetical protein L3i22_019470 [Actinoplanes sp. L3-i22]|nr:hypothetical protein L3i22_019470 [Actinoplanes sp. L3-i22]
MSGDEPVEGVEIAGLRVADQVRGVPRDRRPTLRHRLALSVVPALKLASCDNVLRPGIGPYRGTPFGGSSKILSKIFVVGGAGPHLRSAALPQG